jgi:hypothetical protein
MIDFSGNPLVSKENSQSVLSRANNFAVNSQKLATASEGAFAVTLAQMTADPNSSLVQPCAASSQTPAAGQNSNAAPVGLNALIPPTSAVVTAASAPAESIEASSSTTPSLTASDNAYWASQPAAVQQLRTIQSEPERQQVAMQLANQGYSIDVPVMVWGWDPTMTTQLRESAGYTWVPSGLQQNVSEAPGLNVPGLTPYNPSYAPAGSIAVG